MTNISINDILSTIADAQAAVTRLPEVERQLNETIQTLDHTKDDLATTNELLTQTDQELAAAKAKITAMEAEADAARFRHGELEGKLAALADILKPPVVMVEPVVEPVAEAKAEPQDQPLEPEKHWWDYPEAASVVVEAKPAALADILPTAAPATTEPLKVYWHKPAYMTWANWQDEGGEVPHWIADFSSTR